MKRVKGHKIKHEKPESSTAYSRAQEEHDLAYYIHDRVELMHQVFSVLKPKDIKAMAPACVKNISINNLQELCTEELLGISSKRLCAILDGAEPPSDTESSSSTPDQLETISLDSISSDEELLSQASNKKKKHKHRRRDSKSKSKKRKKSKELDEDADKSRASRAGLTVLELLELQARARAIRAQLQQHAEHARTSETAVVEESQESSDNEVVIKEEPAEVVEISSEDEKPNVQQLEKEMAQTKEPERVQETTVTKRINDLVITVPQAKTTRKIKLNRNTKIMATPTTETNVASKEKTTTNDVNNTLNKPDVVIQDKKGSNVNKEVQKVKDKSKKKKKVKKRNIEKEGSDHDEITLQLSDTEKMDLLENFDRKDYECVSSSEDSSSSGDDEDPKVNGSDKIEQVKDETNIQPVEESNQENVITKNLSEKSNETINVDLTDNKSVENENIINTEELNKQGNDTNMEISTSVTETEIPSEKESNTNNVNETNQNVVKECELAKSETENTVKESEKVKSDGEISDQESSEIEAVDLKNEVVCISDEESKKHKKKKNKKDKKKKEKKSKKSKSDFREGSDENFYKETENINDGTIKEELSPKEVNSSPKDIDDDVYEILELSDDSSCYEVEGVSISKEPTAEEIEAFSLKIDEIEREEVITEEQIRLHEESETVENISWKDRYLDSKKVKKVLSTSNILNAIRKKNKELKKKLEESKQKVETVVPVVEFPVTLEEGSIEQFNTLQPSTTYVDPVKEKDEGNEEEKNTDNIVTGEMKKDAKQLLKMYKRLLKYNDMNKEKDPNKKKKKKKKDKKGDVHTGVANVENNVLNSTD